MSEVVKSAAKRGRRSGDQARATRRRIIGAATDLFVAQGYAASTLEEVAAKAGVSVQTVYFHFSNKRTLLKEAVDLAAAGDDEPVALLERPFIQRIRDEADPRRALAIWTDVSRSIFVRVAPIMQAVRDAAGADPEMADQWATNQRQRATAHRVLAQLLADKRALRPRLSVDRAADIIFALISPELYLLLTTQRGWTPAQWQRWITDTVADAILRSSS